VHVVSAGRRRRRRNGAFHGCQNGREPSSTHADNRTPRITALPERACVHRKTARWSRTDGIVGIVRRRLGEFFVTAEFGATRRKPTNRSTVY